MSVYRVRQQAQLALKQLGAMRRKATDMKALADYGFGPVDIETGIALSLRAMRACDAIDDWQRWREQFVAVQRTCGVRVTNVK